MFSEGRERVQREQNGLKVPTECIKTVIVVIYYIQQGS